MTKYNEAQVDFRDKSKGRIARQLEISKLQSIITTYKQRIVWSLTVNKRRKQFGADQLSGATVSSCSVC